MALTVITLRKVPAALRGELSKWMQEISLGVYIGNLSRRVRERLWSRVCTSVQGGEATITYGAKNELGYFFETWNSERIVVDFDGLPLVLRRSQDASQENELKKGFSNASKYRYAQKVHKRSRNRLPQNLCFIDLETDGLNPDDNKIIEMAAVKIENDQKLVFQTLIRSDGSLAPEIQSLTGITQEQLESAGLPIEEAISELHRFIGACDVVGYNVNFDLAFLNNAAKKAKLPIFSQKTYDLMRYVKREKPLLKNYKLETVLQAYGLNISVPHRAEKDATIVMLLAERVNIFLNLF